MGKVRRANYVFLTWKGDHSPRHVHVYRDYKLVVKWDLEHSLPMKGKATRRLIGIIAELEKIRCAMKIRKISANNRRNEFTVVARSGAEYSFPYSKADPRPNADDPIEKSFVDKELGNEAFTYVLKSGREGSIHIELVLEYHEDPTYLAELLTYKLSVEARKRLERSELSRRQLAKRLKTSVPQLYRLLDPANTSKSMKQLVTLLHILDCDVDLVVKEKAA